MQFESFSEFIQMGGHATFVFSVYLITAAIVIGNIVVPIRQKKRFYIEQAARVRREPSAGKKEPSARKEEPSAGKKEPSALAKEPSADLNKEPPTDLSEKPSAGDIRESS